MKTIHLVIPHGSILINENNEKYVINNKKITALAASRYDWDWYEIY